MLGTKENIKERPWQLGLKEGGWFLMNYDVLGDNNMGGTMVSVMVEIYSTV